MQQTKTKAAKYLLLTTAVGFFILCDAVQAANFSSGEGLTNEQPVSKSKSKRESELHPQEPHFCPFRSRQYLPGDVWYANHTSSPHCVLCICLQNGKLNCTKLDCCNSEGVSEEQNVQTTTTMMMISRTPGLNKTDFDGITACCEACGRMKMSTTQMISQSNVNEHQDERETDSRISSSSSSSSSGNSNSNSHYYDEETLEADQDDPLVAENLEHVSCLHQGRIYRDKEVFAANISGLPISENHDHCLNCICQGGMVLCHQTPCSNFDCAKNSTSRVTEACCRKCNADRQSVNMKSRSGMGPKLKSTERSGSGSGDNMNDIADAQYLYTSAATGEDGEELNGVTAETLSSFTQQQQHQQQQKQKQQQILLEPNHVILSHQFLSPSHPTPSKRAGCISAGRFYFHGSTWHPVIGPFGVMECVKCKCLHSKIECNRLPCPSVSELHCTNLVKLEGHCCAFCPTFTSRQDGIKGEEMCVPAGQDVTVYKSQEYFSTNDTEMTRLSFIRDKGTWNKLLIEVHEWTLVQGKIFRFYTTDYTHEDFINTQKNRPAVILGATTTRNFEKYTKREKKLHFRCKSHCNVRLQSLQLTLRLHSLTAKDKCSPQERNVL